MDANHDASLVTARGQIVRELAKQFGFLRRLAIVELNRALAPLGATAPMYAMLLRLASEGQLSQQELTLDAGMDAAGVSRLVARLAQQKLVSVRVDAADRRRRLVRPTAKGKAYEGALTPVVDSAMRGIVLGLDEAEEFELMRILGKVVMSAMEGLEKARRKATRERARRRSARVRPEDAVR